MAKIKIFCGADGTGKSTIVNEYNNKLSLNGINSKVYWLRFVSFFSKFVNILGRLQGLSYKEKYSWGVVGYHDYNGFIGKLYIFFTFLDHYIYSGYFKLKNAKYIYGKGSDIVIYDRYLVDTIVDLMVDTENHELIFFFYDKLIHKLIEIADIHILVCDYNTVVSRRPDISDDKKYLSRVNGYNTVIKRYKLREINTSENDIKTILTELFDEV